MEGLRDELEINISTVCSLLSSCGDGRQSHVTSRELRGSQGRSGAGSRRGNGKGPRCYLQLRWKPAPPAPHLLPRSPALEACYLRITCLMEASFCCTRSLILLIPSFSYIPSPSLLSGNLLREVTPCAAGSAALCPSPPHSTSLSSSGPP